MNVKTYLNQTRGDRFFAFDAETSALATGPAFEIEGDGQPEELLERVFAIGNHAYFPQAPWPGKTTRSLSVGDVVVLVGVGVWTVESMGFRKITTEDLGRAIVRDWVIEER